MARSPASLRKMGIMDPSLERALKVRPFPELPKGILQRREARAAHLKTLRHLMPVPGPIPEFVTEKEIFVPARDGYQIRCIQYSPANKPAAPAPLVVLFHEGGFTMGDLSDEEFNARMLTRDLGVVCLNVEYRLAPEYPSPTWANDSWDVVQWAAENAPDIGADLKKGFIVGGSSAGGNLSAILAHLSCQTGLYPPITGQWLSAPYLIPSIYLPPQYKAEYLSMTENTHDPVMGKDGISEEAEASIAKMLNAELESPLYSAVASQWYHPTSGDSESTKVLAKAFIQVAGLDPLRDQGLIYDRILRLEYGTDTRVEVYPGFGHLFWANWPELDASKKFAADVVDGFKWLLEK